MVKSAHTYLLIKPILIRSDGRLSIYFNKMYSTFFSLHHLDNNEAKASLSPTSPKKRK